MKETIIKIVAFVAFIGIIVFLAYQIQLTANRDTEIYNNGTHADCGGHWILGGADSNYLYYQCDKYYESFKRMKGY